MSNPSINYFGKVHFRGRDDPFGIKSDDRSRHMYVIGKTGMGKTALLQNMAIQDAINGMGVGIIDPHGDFADRVLDFVPEHRISDVVYFNPADSDFPIGLNLLEDIGYDKRHLVASGLMGVFKKIWVDVWSARMEYILSNAILALMEYPGATMLDVNSMMVNKGFREEVLSHVQDPVVREFWLVQFVNWGERLSGEATAAIENKVGQFTAAPLIRNIIGQKTSTVDLRQIMDQGKIFIINLSKGYIGEENSRLLGAMAVTKLYLAAMSRVDVPEEQRRDFVLYVDEFQNFASEAFEGILSEARKYHLSLVLAHQYIEQLDETVRASVFGNIGTMVSFRVGATDAEHLEKEFTPQFVLEDLVNLGKYHVVLRLMIDGVSSAPFSATTLPPLEPTHGSYRSDIIGYSRHQWSIPRETIERSIQERVQMLESASNKGKKQGSKTSSTPPPARGITQPDGSVLYIAQCDMCKEDTRTIFEPDGKRKIHCKKCRKKQKRAREQAEQEQQEKKSAPVRSGGDTSQSTSLEPHKKKRRRKRKGASTEPVSSDEQRDISPRVLLPGRGSEKPLIPKQISIKEEDGVAEESKDQKSATQKKQRAKQKSEGKQERTKTRSGGDSSDVSLVSAEDDGGDRDQQSSRPVERAKEEQRAPRSSASLTQSSTIADHLNSVDVTRSLALSGNDSIDISLAMARKKYPPPRIEEYYTTSTPRRIAPKKTKEVDTEGLRALLREVLHEDHAS